MSGTKTGTVRCRRHAIVKFRPPAKARGRVRNRCSELIGIERAICRSTVLSSALYPLPMADPHRVFVVLDGEYGQRLEKLVLAGPVWIVDTSVDRTVAERVWAADPNRSHLKGVTTFKFEAGRSREDVLIGELDTIDEHHGTYSANPPYTILEVIGTEISDRIEQKLAGFGFDEFAPTQAGFRAIRPQPKDFSPDRWG